jgi:hypothetical protein
MTAIDELHFTGKAPRCMLVQQPLWQVRETGCLEVLLQALCTTVPHLPEICRQLLAAVLGSSTERIAIIFATNRVREKNSGRSNEAQYWRDYLDKMKIILWFTYITFTHLAVFILCMGTIAISLMAQSLQWLATCWSVGGSNAGVGRWRDSPDAFRPAQPASYKMGTVSLSPTVKRPGLGAHHTSLSIAKVKERVELHIHLPFSACLACTGKFIIAINKIRSTLINAVNQPYYTGYGH